MRWRAWPLKLRTKSPSDTGTAEVGRGAIAGAMYQSQSLHPKFRSFLALSTCYQTGRQGHLTENRCAVFLEEPASEEGESKSISKWVVSPKEYFS